MVERNSDPDVAQRHGSFLALCPGPLSPAGCLGCRVVLGSLWRSTSRL